MTAWLGWLLAWFLSLTASPQSTSHPHQVELHGPVGAPASSLRHLPEAPSLDRIVQPRSAARGPGTDPRHINNSI